MRRLVDHQRNLRVAVVDHAGLVTYARRLDAELRATDATDDDAGAGAGAVVTPLDGPGHAIGDRLPEATVRTG